jgi:hypothetical protein
MGLKPETADMMWDAITIIKGKPVQEPMWSLRPYYYPKKSGILYENEEQVFIPAWSLHRLIEIVSHTQYPYYVISKELPIYDALCERIEWLIKEGYFNKEYLV